jgi:EmrB/QacA subfamily drug resistance transporter
MEPQISVKNIPVTMAGLMLCLFLSALDNSIVGTAMPRIIESLHGLHHYSLPFTSYLLFSTLVIPISGKLSDVYGRKIVVLWGIGLFMLSSVLCGLSVNMLMLILFRGLQGASGGVLASSAFIICAELFPPQQRGKYLGMLVAMHGLASLIGPVTGGLITDYLSWHWIFYINIPIGFCSFFILRKQLPVFKHPDSCKEVDYKGIALFVSALFPFLFCFAEGGKLLPWSSPITIGLMIVSLLMLIGFARAERISHSPLIPIEMLKNDVFKTAAFAAAMGYVALFGLILYIPFLLQIIQHKGAAFAGMIMLPMSLSMVVGGMSGGYITSKWMRFRKSGIINFSLAIIGFFPLLIAGNSIPAPLLVIGIVFTGLGIGLNFPLINMAPQAFFSPSQMGILVSSLEFFQIMGGVISTSVLGNLLHVSTQWLIALCMIALFLGGIVMSRLNENDIRERFIVQYKNKAK